MKLVATRRSVINAMGLTADESACPILVPGGDWDAWALLLNWHAGLGLGGEPPMCGFEWIEIVSEGIVAIHYHRIDRPDLEATSRPLTLIHAPDLPPIPASAWSPA